MLVQRNLFLILKECLHNVVKHAYAKNVSISIMENRNIIELKIQDDGIGFNDSTRRPNGNGLDNLSIRAQVIGGAINIESKLNKGTLLTFRIPLHSTKVLW